MVFEVRDGCLLKPAGGPERVEWEVRGLRTRAKRKGAVKSDTGEVAYGGVGARSPTPFSSYDLPKICARNRRGLYVYSASTKFFVAVVKYLFLTH